MTNRGLDTPGEYRTPRRPGHPGFDRKRPGPAPDSVHPTGPAPPFEQGGVPIQSEAEQDRRHERSRRWPTD